MISNILTTLSDTEIMAIAEQLANESIDEQIVYNQLIHKGNNDENLQDLYTEMTSDGLRGTLARRVALELSNRLRKELKS